MESKSLKVRKLVQGFELSQRNGGSVVSLIDNSNCHELDPFLMLLHFKGKLPEGAPD
eukprot:CAMPEP_0115026550 /NCGR_PEP_ID=MMETSP0216-20121206/34830_1 /TAXON_ID=223996 /ORGANISM="Protocruzia adherens, Strain Boccale" /LENGTH=56 /DNA_ID=CAMNT_0002401681 /DNA_START=32 /DNA_END=199 /DNA_ORIENTATION=+